MHTTDTVVIGAGQAGLSLSHHLARSRQRHVVLERGRVGERWQSERWDSLTLLTPNWLNRLDGAAAHADDDGFLDRAAFVRYLHDYARPQRHHVREHAAVSAVESWRGGFRVATDAGEWRASSVVVATGDAAEPVVPALAGAAPRWLRQLHSSRYRNPAQLSSGGVLVVGAGPSGQQIALELRRAGRDVVLAVGRHSRALRRYRGRDIFEWLDLLGDLERTIDECADPAAARRAANLPLSGAGGGEQLDLGVLYRLGVTITGRLERFDGRRADFAPDLQAQVGAAEGRLQRLVDRIDAHVAGTLSEWPFAADRVRPVEITAGPTTIDLAAAGIDTVIWATGYRRDYPWLHVPALDAAGELVHRHGITEIPGLHALGLKFQRRRASHFIGRVGADAEFIARWTAAPARPSRLDGSPERLYAPRERPA
jgi:putative flavoprotein involved in K+ transport